jgi:demethylspheroidene O-methyltransferase
MDDTVPSMQSGAGHWTDGIWRWRDGLLASPRFQRWAQRFPPTLWIARRRAAALFDLMAGFVYSQVLLACVRLKLFDLLDRHGPMTVAQAAAATGLPIASAERLLLAAVALRLLAHRSLGRFGLGGRRQLSWPPGDNYPGRLEAGNEFLNEAGQRSFLGASLSPCCAERRR